MGTLDFLKEFENRVIDATAYKLLARNFQMQEDNSRLLNEKADLLQAENTRLTERNRLLVSEVKLLREKLASVTRRAEYVTKDGFAFRRGHDGLLEETGYCPNCFSVMGHLMRKTFKCPKCQYTHATQTLPEHIARHMNSQSSETQD